MVVQTKLRRIVRSLCLYVGAVGAIAYFGFHAFNGNHGILAQRQYGAQKAELTAELNLLQAQRQKLEKQLALLKSDSLDPDILDEKARANLGLAHAHDVVIMLGN